MIYTLEIDPKGIAELIAKTGVIWARDTLSRAVTSGGAFLQTWIIENRLTGPRPQFLGVLSNRLRSSIAVSSPETESDGVSVRIGTNVEYARIHEFSGIIFPGTKGFLAWKNRDTGKWIFTKKPVTIPARPFLRPAIEDSGNQEIVKEIISESINKAIEEA